MSNRLEVLADAIALLNEYHDPGSTSYQRRNPGRLTAKGMGPAIDGERVFCSHKAGYAALLDRLEKRAKYHPGETIEQVLSAFGFRDEFSLKDAISFMDKAIQPGPTKNTPLVFFLEKSNE